MTKIASNPHRSDAIIVRPGDVCGRAHLEQPLTHRQVALLAGKRHGAAAVAGYRMNIGGGSIFEEIAAHLQVAEVASPDRGGDPDLCSFPLGRHPRRIVRVESVLLEPLPALLCSIQIDGGLALRLERFTSSAFPFGGRLVPRIVVVAGVVVARGAIGFDGCIRIIGHGSSPALPRSYYFARQCPAPKKKIEDTTVFEL